MKTNISFRKYAALFLIFVSLVTLSSCRKKNLSKPAKTEVNSLLIDISKKPLDANLTWKKILGHYQKMDGKPEEAFLIREDSTKLFIRYGEKDYELTQNTYKEYACKVDNPLKITTINFIIDKKGNTPLCKANDVLYERVTFERKTFDFQNYTPPTKPIRKDVADFVLVSEVDPTLKISLRFSPGQSAYLKKENADALKKVNQSLVEYGYTLILLDAYRPFQIPGLEEPIAAFSTGNTVSVSLFNTRSQQEVEFGSSYLEFSERSKISYLGGTSLERWHKLFLRQMMIQAGFKASNEVWWKFIR